MKTALFEAYWQLRMQECDGTKGLKSGAARPPLGLMPTSSLYAAIQSINVAMTPAVLFTASTLLPA